MPRLTGEITTETEFDFEVFCARCGAGICNNCTEGKTSGRGMPFIQVDPCEKCLATEFDEGYDKGYDKGFEEARKQYEP